MSSGEHACDSSAKQYEDLHKTFVALDAKAQTTATASGVVLAAVVAFVNAGKLTTVLAAGTGRTAWYWHPLSDPSWR